LVTAQGLLSRANNSQARYEKGADIAIARWHQLRLEVHAARGGRRRPKRFSWMICAIRTSRVPWACGSATGHEGCSRT